MAWTDLDPAGQTHEWATALRAALDVRLPDAAFRLTAQPANSDGLQEILTLSRTEGKAHRVEVVVESSLGIMLVGGAEVLYEFDGTPAELESRLSSVEERGDAGAKPVLDEVALVHHALAALRAGYSYLRLPLYERLTIPAYRGSAALNWGTYDLGWPPVVYRRFKPV
ncbi:hypothetical protein [Amycolatopsis tolypomycina]|uniref:Uncharacterized protein n=1 Tax=Amycolatopsis tolypomycina TaxID=208445 RepID=A0A1H4Q4B3_9PSEU|nr:hypothetical protein [Amycolatopsis tolypomycina]SEC14441.1 hypothetical protein SAMN04489727_2725 [Amycolatopsis tolypomycina]